MEKKKSLGQCFLEDRNILAFEAKLADVKGRTVLEIGAGDGRLTGFLLLGKPKKIIAVEKDPRFASILREKFSGKPVDVIEGDFLEADIPKFDLVFGNIPYYISSDIIFTLAGMAFGRGILMVQKEFAQKMVAQPGKRNYGRLSVTSQLAFDVRLERIVLRHLFCPVPKVDSAIIIIIPTGKRISASEQNVIRYLFSHKNKTVRNALTDSKMFEKPQLETLDAKLLSRRVRTLSKEECLEIARLLK